MTDTFPVLPTDRERVSVTLGSGSSRKPSATVTIMAINAEISPASCICKKKKQLMFHFHGTQFHKRTDCEGILSQIHLETKYLHMTPSSTRASEQSCHCELTFWPVFCLPSSPALLSSRAPCWLQMTRSWHQICCWPQRQSAPADVTE